MRRPGIVIGEFELIDLIVAELGEQAQGARVGLGPGDDAALLALPDGEQLAMSVDTLLPDVHFPTRGHPELVGYRALAVSASDLAAMGADPLGALVALVLPADRSLDWVRGLARGMARASAAFKLPIVGGNLARGGCSVSVSVQGSVPAADALVRSGAQPGDGVWVSGQFGGAALALEGYEAGPRDMGAGGADTRTVAQPAHPLEIAVPEHLTAAMRRYYCPQPRLPLGRHLRGRASAAIDVSDGLVADLGHLCRASGVGVELWAAALPNFPGASIEQVLFGGDDYELCFCAPANAIAPQFAEEWQLTQIGRVVAAGEPSGGISLDGVSLSTKGFDHFAE